MKLFVIILSDSFSNYINFIKVSVIKTAADEAIATVSRLLPKYAKATAAINPTTAETGLGVA